MGIAAHGGYVLALFVNDCHPVEVVLRQIQMLTWVIFHWLVVSVILRQLLNFKARRLGTAYLCSLSTLISILVVLVIYCTIWFLLTVYFFFVLTYIDCIWIITFGLSLSWMDHPSTLYFCFLSGASPSTANTSCITSTIILWLWVEVLSSSWKSWQNILIVIFERFVYFRNTLISSLRLKVMHYSLMSISCRSLTPYLVLSLYGFLMLFYMRAKSSTVSAFLYFIFDGA